MYSRILFLTLFALCLVFSLQVQAQEPYMDFYGESLDLNNIGMGFLGGWAVANLTIGAYGWSQHSGQQSYFHQMNLFWNTVNLTIAGLALYSNLGADYGLLSGEELMEKQLKSQRLYLINGALDVGYIGAGFLLRHLANKYPKNELRLRGYGNAVILQGAFLLVFDAVMYLLQRNMRVGFTEQFSFVPMQDAWGLGFSFHF